MSKCYEIIGRPIMNGTIKIQGSKNAALSIIVASLLAKDVVVLENVPNIKDVHELLSIIKLANVKVSFIDNCLIIDSSDIKYTSLLVEQVKHFRASYYLIGAFLSLFNKVEIFLPGGCKIGKRPIDQHIKGLNALNVNLCFNNETLKASASTIIGNDITLDMPSVGATINIILASLYAEGKTLIKNAAKEPEIVDFINFLNKMGANISGAGSEVIVINPTTPLHKSNYHIMPDRIVTQTYLLYGAMFADKLTLTNVSTKDNYSLINTLINMGAQIDIRNNRLTIYKFDHFEKANIKTGVYPLFPSDIQQIMCSFLFNGRSVSVVEETLFENRFLFLKEIEKMGGKYFAHDNKVIIVPSVFKGSVVSCNDLRGGAALLFACLCAKGTSILKNVEYIERGYENIVETLQKVNVKIKEIDYYEA